MFNLKTSAKQQQISDDKIVKQNTEMMGRDTLNQIAKWQSSKYLHIYVKECLLEAR